MPPSLPRREGDGGGVERAGRPPNNLIFTALNRFFTMSVPNRFTLLSGLLAYSLSLSATPVAPGWNNLGAGLNGPVNAVVVSGDDVYVGGGFTDAGGIADADYLARWDGSAWHAVAAGLSAQVRSIAISGSNIYVGGNFANAGGIAAADFVARWDGSAWHSLGTGVVGAVHSIVISGSNVYAGGDFSSAGGIAAAKFIARWNGSAWSALGSGLNNFVRGMALKGSNLYVTGNFTDAGGNPAADRIARWDGSSWNALGTPNLNSYGLTIAIAGNDVYIGGPFTDAAGIPEADRVARFDGTNWHALGSGIAFLASSVYTLAYDGAYLFAGGSFFNAGGNNAADYIARWDGSSWENLGNTLGSAVRSIAVTYNNLYVGGDFSPGAGNANINYIARWEYTSLPVELSDFRADPHAQGVLLRWQTESESQNHYFQIEHSTGGAHFSPIGRVEGYGNSAQTRYYSFLHQNPPAGLNYYRLRQVDFDETAHYSPIVSVRITGKGAITLTPNPASDYFQIRGLGDATTRVRLSDAEGRLLWEGEGREGEPVDLAAFPRGYYFVEIQSGPARQTIRVVKESR